MLNGKTLKLSKYLPYFAMISTVAAGLAAAQDAGAQTADDVLNRMSDEERFAYLSGVVEGLATSRWVADQPDSSRMQCVYDWYFGQNVKVRQTVIAWLERNPDQRAGILMHVLVERQCPNE